MIASRLSVKPIEFIVLPHRQCDDQLSPASIFIEPENPDHNQSHSKQRTNTVCVEPFSERKTHRWSMIVLLSALRWRCRVRAWFNGRCWHETVCAVFEISLKIPKQSDGAVRFFLEKSEIRFSVSKPSSGDIPLKIGLQVKQFPKSFVLLQKIDWIFRIIH